MRSKCRWIIGPLLLLLVTACARPKPAEPVVSPVPPAQTDEVALYFPHQSRPVLLKERRQVERRGEQPERLALQQLMEGPRSPEARPATPVVLTAKVLDGHVAVILTQPAAAALAESDDLLALQAVVNTLCAFPRVTSVSFHVEGRPDPLRVAGIDIAQPMQPRWDLVQE